MVQVRVPFNIVRNSMALHPRRAPQSLKFVHRLRCNLNPHAPHMVLIHKLTILRIMPLEALAVSSLLSNTRMDTNRTVTPPIPQQCTGLHPPLTRLRRLVACIPRFLLKRCIRMRTRIFTETHLVYSTSIMVVLVRRALNTHITRLKPWFITLPLPLTPPCLTRSSQQLPL